MMMIPTSRKKHRTIVISSSYFKSEQIAARLDYRRASYVRTIIQRVRRDYGMSEA